MTPRRPPLRYHGGKWRVAPWIISSFPSHRIYVEPLRLGWLSSAERAPFVRSCMPDVYVLPDRPSFRGDGGSDVADYAWMVWHADEKSCGCIEVLATTPIGERRNQSGG